MSKQTRASHPINNLLPTEIEGFDSLAELALDMGLGDEDAELTAASPSDQSLPDQGSSLRRDDENTDFLFRPAARKGPYSCRYLWLKADTPTPSGCINEYVLQDKDPPKYRTAGVVLRAYCDRGDKWKSLPRHRWKFKSRPPKHPH